MEAATTGNYLSERVQTVLGPARHQGAQDSDELEELSMPAPFVVDGMP